MIEMTAHDGYGMEFSVTPCEYGTPAGDDFIVSMKMPKDHQLHVDGSFLEEIKTLIDVAFQAQLVLLSRDNA